MERVFFQQNIQKLILRLLLLAVTASFVTSLILIYRHISYKDAVTNEAKARVISHTVQAAKEIDDVLKKRMLMAQSIADDLTAGRLRKEEILAKIKKIVDENPQVYGIGVAYKPFEYDRRTRLYAPYCSRAHGKAQLQQTIFGGGIGEITFGHEVKLALRQENLHRPQPASWTDSQPPGTQPQHEPR